MNHAIADNLRDVNERIAEAARRSGRAPSEIKLIAVSKTHSIDLIKHAFASGQRVFGENYVQEALAKIEQLSQAEWHLIGSLQSKKAKLVTGRFALIHSVDRDKLADELAKAAGSAGIVQDILMQVHIGGEETKSGVSTSEAPALIEKILASPSLRLRGLMALPPLSDDERVARGYFAQLLGLRDKWAGELLNSSQRMHFTELSIGTSSDFEWAILEGATMVRVGTSIFGEREYSQGS